MKTGFVNSVQQLLRDDGTEQNIEYAFEIRMQISRYPCNDNTYRYYSLIHLIL